MSLYSVSDLEVFFQSIKGSVIDIVSVGLILLAIVLVPRIIQTVFSGIMMGLFGGGSSEASDSRHRENHLFK